MQYFISIILYMIVSAYLNKHKFIVVKQMIITFTKDIKQMKAQIEKDEQ